MVRRDATGTAPLGAVTLDAIGAVPPGEAIVAYIRHSEREPVVDLARAGEAPLTPAGERAAVAWGRALPAARPLRLLHSPVGRCAATARHIAAGFAEAGGRARLDGVEPTLFVPYVRDFVELYALASRRGFEAFLRAWLDGAIGASIIQPRAEAASSQLAVLEAALGASSPGELTVLVSHDWNVLLLREHYLGVRHEEAGWAGFLEGPIATRDGDGTRLAWAGRSALARPA